MTILVFLASSHTFAQAKKYPTRCSHDQLPQKLECIEKHLEKKLINCTNDPHLLDLKYEVKKFYPGQPDIGGYTPKNSEIFYIYTRTIQRDHDHILKKYSKKYPKAKALEIAAYLSELEIMNIMIHEALHMMGHKHSVGMEQKIEELLICAGEKSVYDYENNWAKWVYEL